MPSSNARHQQRQTAAGTPACLRERRLTGVGAAAGSATSGALALSARFAAAGWRALSFAAAALSFSRRFLISSRMITWAALATADRAASGTESSAARNACATGFAPRGARLVAVVVSVLAILVVAPFRPSGLVGCTRRSHRNDAPDFGRTR